MPVYESEVRGEPKPRLVRADSAAQARAHLVTAKTVTAERMADLLADGVKLETAGAEAQAEVQAEEGEPRTGETSDQPPTK